MNLVLPVHEYMYSILVHDNPLLSIFIQHIYYNDMSLCKCCMWYWYISIYSLYGIPFERSCLVYVAYDYCVCSTLVGGGGVTGFTDLYITLSLYCVQVSYYKIKDVSSSDCVVVTCCVHFSLIDVSAPLLSVSLVVHTHTGRLPP